MSMNPGEGDSWWYRTPSGEEFGPYSDEELQAYSIQGRIEPAGMVRSGNPGDTLGWRMAAEVLPALGGAMPGNEGSPPTTMPRPPRAGGEMAASNTSQLTYILLALLPFFFFALTGIHNLVVGRNGVGATQLILSLIGIYGFGCIGVFTAGLGWCVAGPIYLGLLIWVIVDVCTVRTDGAGRPFTS